MKKATSSPVRVERCSGLIFFRVTAVYLGGDVYPGIEVSGVNYQKTKKRFWDELKEAYPGYWFEPRMSK